MSREDIELKKELEFRRRQIIKLEQELKDRDERLMHAELEADKFKQADRQFQKTKEGFDQTIMDRVKSAIEVEKDKYRKLVDELTSVNETLRREKESLLVDKNLIDEKNSEIAFLHSKLREVADNLGVAESLKDLQKDRNYTESIRKELEVANHN
jgi:hypothetical protein